MLEFGFEPVCGWSGLYNYPNRRYRLYLNRLGILDEEAEVTSIYAKDVKSLINRIKEESFIEGERTGKRKIREVLGV